MLEDESEEKGRSLSRSYRECISQKQIVRVDHIARNVVICRN